MIKSSEIYTDFVVDNANKDENGDVSYTQFNRMLWKVQLRMMGWLTGNFDEVNPPEKISPQKTRELLSVFLVKLPKQVISGEIARPDDYYSFHNVYAITGKTNECADKYEEETVEVTKKAIQILDNSKFTIRAATRIECMKPKNKPIAKLAGAGFEFLPEDIGSVVLEYYRLPVKARIVTKKDATYNDVVPDEVNSVNLEWMEQARPYLLHFLNQEFSLPTRDMAFQQQNQMNKP